MSAVVALDYGYAALNLNLGLKDTFTKFTNGGWLPRGRDLTIDRYTPWIAALDKVF